MTKYSIKNICLGIGIGLIIASMANISAAPQSLTKEQIEREANRYGLIVMEAKDFIQKQPDQQEPNETTEPKQVQTVEIVISQGAASESIAESLIKGKLISSKEDFLNRLAELKKESKLQVGTFKIPSGSSIDEIISIITSTPN